MITDVGRPGFYSLSNQLLVQMAHEDMGVRRIEKAEDDVYEALTTLGKGRGERRARYIEYMTARGL